MAPNNTASAARHSSSVALGSGSPVRSMAAPPNGAAFIWKSCPNFFATRSSTRVPSATTSGPIPSPAMTAIFAFMTLCSLLTMRAFVRGNGVVLREQEAELVDAVQQAVLGETLQRKFHLRAIGQRERGARDVDGHLDIR